MTVALILSLIISSMLASTIMVYIAIATPLGPWIEPLFALIALAITRLFFKSNYATSSIKCVAAASGMAGIAAVACGFSFPTLYFLQKDLFLSWVQTPLTFMSVLGGLIIVAAVLVFFLTSLFEHDLLDNQQLTFPVAQMVEKTISNSHHHGVLQIGIGALIASAWAALDWTTQNIVAVAAALRSVGLHNTLSTVPIMLSLGFIAGSTAVVPLLCGLLTKYAIIGPAKQFFFSDMSIDQITVTWCSGFVLWSALHGIAAYFLSMFKAKKAPMHYVSLIKKWLSVKASIYAVIVLLPALLFFFQFQFSSIAIMYIIVFTLICAYQVVIIAGKIGLAPLGRFATFVMLPGLVIFGFNAVQATIVATFVELCSGLAADGMFGRKLADIGHISKRTMIVSQIIGVLVAAITIACVMMLLAKNIGFGTAPLFAQRAQARALLINFHDFNKIIMLCGFVFGFIVQQFSVNSMLILSGLLMGSDQVILLMTGGIINYYVKNADHYYALCSAIFAVNSLIMITKMLL